MRNKREHTRRAVVLILAVAGLITCTAPSLTSSGLTSAQALRANGKIAFTSDRDGNREIYVMNADGTNQVVSPTTPWLTIIPPGRLTEPRSPL